MVELMTSHEIRRMSSSGQFTSGGKGSTTISRASKNTTKIFKVMEVHGSSMMFYGVLCILFYGRCAQPPCHFLGRAVRLRPHSDSKFNRVKLSIYDTSWEATCQQASETTKVDKSDCYESRGFVWGPHTIVTLSVANDNLFAKCYQALPSDRVEGGHHETHASQQHHGDASHRSTSEENSCSFGPGLPLWQVSVMWCAKQWKHKKKLVILVTRGGGNKIHKIVGNCLQQMEGAKLRT